MIVPVAAVAVIVVVSAAFVSTAAKTLEDPEKVAVLDVDKVVNAPLEGVTLPTGVLFKLSKVSATP